MGTLVAVNLCKIKLLKSEVCEKEHYRGGSAGRVDATKVAVVRDSHKLFFESDGRI
jgi:hypothetical protein